MSRYDGRVIFKNQDESYAQIFEERQVPYIRHYGTARMLVPNVRQRRDLTRINHIWKVGDRFYKLAIKHYGSASYWWVIALYNKAPTESSLRVGNTIIVPLPLDRVLHAIGT